MSFWGAAGIECLLNIVNPNARPNYGQSGNNRMLIRCLNMDTRPDTKCGAI